MPGEPGIYCTDHHIEDDVMMHLAAVISNNIIAVWTDDGLSVKADYASRHGSWVGTWTCLVDALDAWYMQATVIISDERVDAAVVGLQQLVEDLQNPQT